MPQYLEQAIDDIDSALFTGDEFLDEDNAAELRRILSRWDRRLKELEELAKSEET